MATQKPAGPAYRVETRRLVIRCWTPEDAPKLRRAIDELDSHLRPWIPWMRSEPQSLDQTVARLRSYRASFDLDRDYRYAVFDEAEAELIGETGLYTRAGVGAREIGYWTHLRHGGQGFAVEAAAAMVRVAFEVDGVDRLEIHCARENEASARVPLRLGFTHEATLARRIEDTEGRLRDAMIWTLLRSAYAGSPASEMPTAAYGCLGERLL